MQTDPLSPYWHRAAVRNIQATSALSRGLERSEPPLGLSYRKLGTWLLIAAGVYIAVALVAGAIWGLLWAAREYLEPLL